VTAILRTTGAGLEYEVHQELARISPPTRSPVGFYVPWQAVARAVRFAIRAPYQVGTASQGGNLVATNLLADSFIDLLRPRTTVLQLGAVSLPGMVGNAAIPSQTAGTTTYWVGESSAPTEAEGTFGQVPASPKTVAALSKFTRQLARQATPAADVLLARTLVSDLALALDYAALNGTGAGGQPIGILNASGITSASGATLTYAHGSSCRAERQCRG
jgi:HK97 family phage major capsid protein